MKKYLTGLLSHPLSRGLDIDDPATTILRRDIIRSKPFLKRIYDEWYADISGYFSQSSKVLELGTGAGFLKEYMNGLITSEVFPTAGIDLVVDAKQIPMEDESLDGIVMTNVLHHIPDCIRFFKEAERTIRPGGTLVMIEPWFTPWSGFVYKTLHHEPFSPNVAEWAFAGQGTLSDANGALPWIVFKRDKNRFEALFPDLRIEQISPMMPLSYILSGGISMRAFLPGWSFDFIRSLEKMTVEKSMAMFVSIVITKVGQA